MTKKRAFLLLVFIVGFFLVRPLCAEKISLKFSFSMNSYTEGDLEEWVRSLNSLWQDFSTLNPGSVTGEFIAPSYGSNLEVELRIPIYKGFGLNLSGSRLSGSEEGEVVYIRDAANQEQNQYIMNDVRALNLKIGLSYRAEMPFLPGLHVFANVGRILTFTKYDVQDNWQSILRLSGMEFLNAYEKENSYSSDGLGFYAGLGFEYDLVKYVALVVEVEKAWSKTDGYKGSHYFKIFTDSDTLLLEEGTATLFYYESTQFALPEYYPILNGQLERPEGETFQNIRHGELNFSRFSVKLGVRFKF
ncbi:MAG: hypothetical protein JXB23_12655 [Candidatus Aminicenantes bacterium]|nr:hypothetical protein [Candidatus Aminicenantes bacterium]